MTDKEILESVYEKLGTRAAIPSTQDAGSVCRFIEEEWQKRDERGLSESDQALYLEEAEEAEAERMRNKVAEELYNNLPRID